MAEHDEPYTHHVQNTSNHVLLKKGRPVIILDP